VQLRDGPFRSEDRHYSYTTGDVGASCLKKGFPV
jgi:hypothetical protein